MESASTTSSRHQLLNGGSSHDSEMLLETRVLVIYTGGTIGMQRDKTGALVPIPGALAVTVRSLPQMHDQEYAKKFYGHDNPSSMLVLPDLENQGRRVWYTILEWEHLIDSSDMTVDEWSKIAKEIQENYLDFDGFVVLHGTDTMSYTASALSFMLEHLGKPVVVTGSQIPIFASRSDGADNFISALIVASTQNVPEVTIFFGRKLYRGNRCSKVASDNFNAFNSPNYEALAISGISLEINERALFRPSEIAAFRAQTSLNRNVALLRIFPSITSAAVHAFLQPPIEGVVLQTYGAGNIPSNRSDLHAELRDAVDRNVIIVNITQCATGKVEAIYKTGQCLTNCGVICGYDMTPEAALTKLSYVLSKEEWDHNTKCLMMETSIRGELTGKQLQKVKDYSVIDAVGKCIGASGPKEASEICLASVMPALLSYAAVHSRPDLVNVLRDYGADVCASNADGRTPLHVASGLGRVSVIKQLLLAGANVHAKDRYGNTPLLDAVHSEMPEAVEVLRKCGAHLPSGDAIKIAHEINCAASNGSIKRLELYKLAGADLSSADATGRTALHMAYFHNQQDVIEYLQDEGLSSVCPDKFGMIPVWYASIGGHSKGKITNGSSNHIPNDIINNIPETTNGVQNGH